MGLTNRERALQTLGRQETSRGRLFQRLLVTAGEWMSGDVLSEALGLDRHRLGAVMREVRESLRAAGLPLQVKTCRDPFLGPGSGYWYQLTTRDE